MKQVILDIFKIKLSTFVHDIAEVGNANAFCCHKTCKALNLWKFAKAHLWNSNQTVC